MTCSSEQRVTKPQDVDGVSWAHSHSCTPALWLLPYCDSEIHYRMSTHYSRVAVYNQSYSFKPLLTHWCLPQITGDSRESSGRRRGGSLFPPPCFFLLLSGKAGCMLSASCLPLCFSLLSCLPRWSQAWSTTLLI